MEDLFQIGSIGLLKAVDKFGVSYDVKFSTYAVPMIIGEIKRYLRDDGILKVSRSLKENHYRIYQVREALTRRLSGNLRRGNGSGNGNFHRRTGNDYGIRCRGGISSQNDLSG